MWVPVSTGVLLMLSRIYANINVHSAYKIVLTFLLWQYLWCLPAFWQMLQILVLTWCRKISIWSTLLMHRWIAQTHSLPVIKNGFVVCVNVAKSSDFVWHSGLSCNILSWVIYMHSWQLCTVYNEQLKYLYYLFLTKLNRWLFTNLNIFLTGDKPCLCFTDQTWRSISIYVFP